MDPKEQQQKEYKEESPGSEKQQTKKYTRLRILFTDPDATESSSDDDSVEKVKMKKLVFENIVHGSFALPSSSPASCVGQKKPDETKKQKVVQGARGDGGEDKLGEINKQRALHKHKVTSGDGDGYGKKQEEINEQCALHKTEQNRSIVLSPTATTTGSITATARLESLHAFNGIEPLSEGVNGGGSNRNRKKSNKNEKNNTDCCCDLPLGLMKIPGPGPTDMESLTQDKSVCLAFFHDLPDC